MDEPETPRPNQIPVDHVTRCLYVDDQKTDRALLAYAFDDPVYRSRFELATVASIVEAQDKISREPDRWDVVLLDLNLDATEGVETFVEFRRAVPGVPVIAFAAGNQHRRVIEAMGAQYISKGDRSMTAIVASIQKAVRPPTGYRAAGLVDVVRTPEAMRTEVEDVRGLLLADADSLPPGAANESRAMALVLEQLLEQGAKLGSLETTTSRLATEVEFLHGNDRDTMASIADIKTTQAADRGETTRVKWKTIGKVAGAALLMAGGAGHREVVTFLAKVFGFTP